MNTTEEVTKTQFNLAGVQRELAAIGISSEVVELATTVLLVDLKVGAAQLMVADPDGMVALTGDVDDYRWSFQVFDADECDVLHEGGARAGNSHRVIARRAAETFTDYVQSLTRSLY